MTKSNLISQRLVDEAVALGGARLSSGARLKHAALPTSDGHVRSRRLKQSLDETGEWFFQNIFRHPNGCWIWMGAMYRTGYGWLKVNGRHASAHRVALCLHSERPLDYPLLALHTLECHAPICVKPDHLYWGSYSDNALDLAVKRRAEGLGGNNQILSLSQADEIRRSSLSNREAANKYGVKYRHIVHIRRNVTLVDPTLPTTNPLLHLLRPQPI